jgi:hypothetical protein
VKGVSFSGLGGKQPRSCGAIGPEELVGFSDDDMLRSFDQCVFMSLKRDPLHPASKFKPSFDIGGSIGFKYKFFCSMLTITVISS